ncbi:MAG: BrnT family toxin [Deltaproteobacteria bacterium]|nr:BrnT family toxin [Deltaproteobacteria bacterium]
MRRSGGSCRCSRIAAPSRRISAASRSRERSRGCYWREPGRAGASSFESSRWQRVLVVIHTNRGELVRIISARPATSHERRHHEEG